jgi:hypothetical protein
MHREHNHGERRLGVQLSLVEAFSAVAATITGVALLPALLQVQWEALLCVGAAALEQQVREMKTSKIRTIFANVVAAGVDDEV